MKVGLWIGPVPFCDDDVPLDALRPRRRGRHFARRDPIGPVREHRQRALATELTVEATGHPCAGLS